MPEEQHLYSIRREYENYYHVTVYNYNDEPWSLMQDDINGYCRHLQCYGPVSYVAYKDDDGFVYSIKRPLYDENGMPLQYCAVEKPIQ